MSSINLFGPNHKNLKNEKDRREKELKQLHFKRCMNSLQVIMQFNIQG